MNRKLIRDDKRVLVLRPLSSGEPMIEIDRKKIRRRQRSTVSPMPAGMANTLPKEQLLDLMAYLLSDGDSTGPMFR